MHLIADDRIDDTHRGYTVMFEGTERYQPIDWLHNVVAYSIGKPTGLFTAM